MAKVNYPEVRYQQQEPPELIRSGDVVTLLKRIRELEAENAILRAAAGWVVAAYRSDNAEDMYPAAGRLAAVLESGDEADPRG